MKLCFYITVSAYLLKISLAVFHNGDYYNRSQVTLAEPQRKFGLIEGNFTIGALFPIHERPLLDGHDNPLLCGSIKEIYGIQRVEAAFYAVDLINGDSSILPNITLGIEIRDECWSAPVALHQTLKLMYKSVTYPSCDYNNASLCERAVSPLIGVIGPAGSSVAMPVQNLLQLFKIPQIGYSTTSEDFSDNKDYKNFLKLVPPDRHQANAMVDILLHFNWTYVSVIYSDENYGRSGIKAFKSSATKSNICIAVEEGVLGNAEPARFDEIVSKLHNDANANVVVCFCEGPAITYLLRSVEKFSHEKRRRFLFIGSDGWAGRNDVVEKLEEYAQGSITIQIHSPVVENFDSYYHKLRPNLNQRDPWFVELWQQQQHNCSFSYKNTSSSLSCFEKEEPSSEYVQDPKLSLVVKSIYVYAHALHQMSVDLCGQNSDPCEKLLNFNTTLFKDYLMNVSFSYQNETVKFDKNGTIPDSSYDILNYQVDDNKQYKYVKIGSWINRNLTIQDTFQLPGSPTKMIKSVCSFPCPPGHEKKIEGKKCCWSCVSCPSDSISDGNVCSKCETGFYPNKNKTECKEIKPKYIMWSDTQAIISIVLSTVGIVATVFIGFVFVLYSDTPIVRSSTKELCYMMLIGMILAHCVTFVMIAKPTNITCAIGRVLPGFSFGLIYAPLLMRTTRIARILNTKNGFPKTKLCLMSTKSQLYISSFLIGIESFVCISMLLIEPAEAILVYQLDMSILKCNTSICGLVMPLLFNGLLILMCTTYAFKTRSVPQNFNEARFIGFSMYATCITWIAFTLIYFSSSLKVSVACVCISTNALVMLIFLFAPKIYIILLKPEKNDRSYFVTTKGLRTHFGRFSTRGSSSVENEEFLNKNSVADLEVPQSCYILLQKCDGYKKAECRNVSCQTSPKLIRQLLNNFTSENDE